MAPGLVIDALFGAGLSRPLDGLSRAMIAAIKQAGFPWLPSMCRVAFGGDLGRPGRRGRVRAQRTVTFFRKSPRMFCFPGTRCADTYICCRHRHSRCLSSRRSGPRQTFENDPELWLEVFLWPGLGVHKYKRGHAVVVSGPAHATGSRAPRRSRRTRASARDWSASPVLPSPAEA